MKHKVYRKEFSLDALNLVKKKGYAATARDLGISKISLRNWAKRYNFSQQADGYQTLSIADARMTLFEYIEVWYNRQRGHSSLGYLCPVEYEKSIAKRP